MTRSGEATDGEDEEYDNEYYNGAGEDYDYDNEYYNGAGDDYGDGDALWRDSCVTQLKLHTLDKLSSTIFCCLIMIYEEEEEKKEEEEGNYDDDDNDDDAFSHDSLTSSGETS